MRSIIALHRPQTCHALQQAKISNVLRQIGVFSSRLLSYWTRSNHEQELRLTTFQPAANVVLTMRTHDSISNPTCITLRIQAIVLLKMVAFVLGAFAVCET